MKGTSILLGFVLLIPSVALAEGIKAGDHAAVTSSIKLHIQNDVNSTGFNKPEAHLFHYGDPCEADEGELKVTKCQKDAECLVVYRTTKSQKDLSCPDGTIFFETVPQLLALPVTWERGARPCPYCR